MGEKIYDVGISALRKELEAIEGLDLDIGPEITDIPDGRIAIYALVDKDQLSALQALPLELEILRETDAAFPSGMIMSTQSFSERMLQLARDKIRNQR